MYLLSKISHSGDRATYHTNGMLGWKQYACRVGFLDHCVQWHNINDVDCWL